MPLSAQESKTHSRASCVNEEKRANLPTAYRLWRRESQKLSSCRNCARTALRGADSRARAIASGTPISDADGQPFPAGANVSQIASSALPCRAERFIKRASVAESAICERISHLQLRDT